MATIGMLAFIFVGMTWINRVLEGQFIQTADTTLVNSMIIFRPFSVFGWFDLPIPNFSFVTEGLPKLLTWDYSFFSGNAEMIVYLLYSISAFVMFALFLAIIGAVAHMLGRVR